MLAGFQRVYQLDWRRAVDTMWHRDLGVLVDELDPEPAWSRTDENVAKLVDRIDFWLNAMWQEWTTDPDDPDVKVERERRKRAGIKPSPTPIIPPVAARPPELHQLLMEQYQRRRAEADEPPRKKVSVAEFMAMRGK